MSKSANTMFVFSLYLYVLGAILVLIPNLLLRLFFFPATDEVWIRVVGMLVFLLGFYSDLPVSQVSATAIIFF